MTKLRNYLMLLIVLLITASCGDDNPVNNPDNDTTPSITSISPTAIYSKAIFSINGKNFGIEKPTVYYTETDKAEVLSYNDTLITARFEAKPGTYNICVEVKNVKSNTKSIVIEEVPKDPELSIIEITPTSGYRGDTITLKGTLFGETRELNTVNFGEFIVPNYNYVLWCDTLIKCIVPQSTAFGVCDVFVTTTSSTSNKVPFEVLITKTQPKILAIAPTDAVEIGGQVTILGEDFGEAQLGDSYVLINDIKITEVISWASTMIKLLVPEGAVTGKIQVVSNGTESNKYDIKIKKPSQTGAPTITSLSTSEIAVNSGVQIKGNNFGTSMGEVYLGDIKLDKSNILKWQNESIRITAPAKGLKTGNLYIVTSEGVKSNEFAYTLKVNDRLKMVLIKAGSFTMGNNESEELSEKPEHSVTLTKDYYVSATEITQRQYKWCITTNAFVPPNTDDSPANNITFINACQFCNLLSIEAGLDTCYIIEGDNVIWNYEANGYRLLTDAEWEYAAKAGTNSPWGFVDGILKQYAWTSSNSGSTQTPLRVGQKDPNPWGLYDMLGNVEEWVWDIYDWDYYGLPNNSIDPKGPTTGSARVVRGGCFESSDDLCKTTSKASYTQTQRKYSLGFRIARTK